MSEKQFTLFALPAADIGGKDLWRAGLHTKRELIDMVAQYCAQPGTSLEDRAGIALVEESPGRFVYERLATEEELFIAAKDVLAEQGPCIVETDWKAYLRIAEKEWKEYLRNAGKVGVRGSRETWEMAAELVLSNVPGDDAMKRFVPEAATREYSAGQADKLIAWIDAGCPAPADQVIYTRANCDDNFFDIPQVAEIHVGDWLRFLVEKYRVHDPAIESVRITAPLDDMVAWYGDDWDQDEYPQPLTIVMVPGAFYFERRLATNEGYSEIYTGTISIYELLDLSAKRTERYFHDTNDDHVARAQLEEDALRLVPALAPPGATLTGPAGATMGVNLA